MLGLNTGPKDQLAMDGTSHGEPNEPSLHNLLTSSYSYNDKPEQHRRKQQSCSGGRRGNKGKGEHGTRETWEAPLRLATQNNISRMPGVQNVMVCIWDVPKGSCVEGMVPKTAGSQVGTLGGEGSRRGLTSSVDSSID
jgi:hypothetical protein